MRVEPLFGIQAEYEPDPDGLIPALAGQRTGAQRLSQDRVQRAPLTGASTGPKWPNAGMGIPHWRTGCPSLAATTAEAKDEGKPSVARE